MPFWFRTLLARLRGDKVERHTFKFNMSARGTEEDAKVMAHEIEAELARQLSGGNSPEATRAAIEEIARRHGGTVEGFKGD